MSLVTLREGWGGEEKGKGGLPREGARRVPIHAVLPK